MIGQLFAVWAWRDGATYDANAEPDYYTVVRSDNASAAESLGERVISVVETCDVLDSQPLDESKTTLGYGKLNTVRYASGPRKGLPVIVPHSRKGAR
jgi:hypothetical protein